MLTKLSLLVMRVGTGMLLVLWGSLRLFQTEAGPGLAEKYYGGIGAASSAQLAFAVVEVVIGVLVVVGLFRRITLIAQAVILVGGALAIWRHFLDPFGLYLFAEPGDANLLFFPSVTVAGAALALIALREFDTLALDRLIARGN